MSAEEPLDIDENLFETTKRLEYAQIMPPSQHVESALRLPPLASSSIEIAFIWIS